MEQASGNKLDSRLYADINIRYQIPFSDDSLTAVLGAINLFDEDPATCDSCNVIGMAPVVHDLPGTRIFVRLVWRMQNLM
jgi:outer membrane receptor protein involved in Fe transport